MHAQFKFVDTDRPLLLFFVLYIFSHNKIEYSLQVQEILMQGMKKQIRELYDKDKENPFTMAWDFTQVEVHPLSALEIILGRLIVKLLRSEFELWYAREK